MYTGKPYTDTVWSVVYLVFRGEQMGVEGQLKAAIEVLERGCYRPFPRARREFGMSITPCLGLPLNRGKCTVISLDKH